MSNGTNSNITSFSDGFTLLETLLANITGDRNVALLTYLTMVSCRLKKPLGIIIFGSSSSGKSYIVKQIAKLFPEQWCEIVSKISPMVLSKLGQSYLANKILVLDESVGKEQPETAYTLRIIMSEGIYTYWVTGPGQTPQKQVIEGPISLIETTSSDIASHAEDNLNRMILIETDHSMEQTEAIMKTQAHKASSFDTSPKNRSHIQEEHKTFLLSLDTFRVVIPYAEKIIPRIYSINSRRDFPKALTIIETICHLRQHVKPTKIYEGKEYLEADLRDYELAYPLLTFAFKNTANAIESLRIHHDRLKLKCKKDMAFNRRDVEAWLGLGSTKTKYLLRELCEHNFITVTQPSKSNKPARYMLADTIQNGSELFITPEELAAFCGQNKNDRTSPLNDEVMPAGSPSAGLH